jgi:hypothetical protein
MHLGNRGPFVFDATPYITPQSSGVNDSRSIPKTFEETMKLIESEFCVARAEAQLEPAKAKELEIFYLENSNHVLLFVALSK